MSWTAPYTPVPGDMMTAAIWATQVRDNFNEVRAGGLAIAGQVANRIPYASSATQLATSANLTFDGTNFLVTGNARATGTLTVNGNFDVNTSRMTVNASTGNTAIAGVLTVSGSGAHTFSAAGPNGIVVVGTGASQYAYATFTAGTVNTALTTYAQSWSTSGIAIAGTTLLSNDTGGGSGLTLAATAAGGVIRFYSGGVSERMRLHGSGGLSIGNTSDPGTGGLSVNGTADVYGNFAINTSKVTINASTGDTVVAGDARFGTTSNFSWVSKSVGTVYQAASDGLVIAAMAGSETSAYYDIVSDASNPPTTIRAFMKFIGHGPGNSEAFTMVCPVKKGDFWKIEDSFGVTGTAWWVPLGFNG